MTMTVEKRIENEKRIFRKLVEILKAHGWELINVSDGEEAHLVTTANEAIEHVFAVDESWTYFTNGKGETHVVYIILGNGNDGYDMITDYSLAETDDFEQAMDAHSKWLDQEQA